MNSAFSHFPFASQENVNYAVNKNIFSKAHYVMTHEIDVQERSLLRITPEFHRPAGPG